MLPSRAEGGHHCLVASLRDKVLTLPSLSMMLAVGVSQILFHQVGEVPLFLLH